MRTAVVIEIAAAAQEQLPLELLEAAYRASASAPIVLVVPRMIGPIVDRALDPVVATVGIEVKGVRYIARHDVDRIRIALFECAWAVAATSEFRSLCESMKVPMAAAGAAVGALRSPLQSASILSMTQAPEGERARAI